MSVLGLLRRAAAPPAPDIPGIGTRLLATRVPGGCALPAGCCGVIVSADGRARRAPQGKLAPEKGEYAWCFHPGPYSADLKPFAAAPEIGLRLSFAVDSLDPRQVQQRFDLYLASEGGEKVELAEFVQAVEAALQRELAQGNLELPPCTTLDEWNAFRAGLNQLLYTRFGVTVDDCVPVDLADTCDYAAILQARAAAAPSLQASPAVPGAANPAPFDPNAADAAALRRLFLELPCVMCQLRLAAMPEGPGLFRQQQALLRQLDLASLSVGTMPALELVAPGVMADVAEQTRRARHSRRAAASLDEGWALLARLERAPQDALPTLFDQFERIAANLERDLAARRATSAVTEAP